MSWPDWFVRATQKLPSEPGSAYVTVVEPRGYSTAVEIHTLDGVVFGQTDDWIIRGVQGEIYPCKPDIFEATYDPVETEEAVK